MEHFLACYLEQFNSVPRNSLHDRRKRYDMVDYISTLIEACREKNEEPEDAANEAVTHLIDYHEKMRSTNSNVCLMGKYHNILYVALKLCYLWQLKNTKTIASLLDKIYACEKTFERLFIGAIFGNKAPHFIAGWKSDFDDQEENLRAVVYFLDRANKACLNYCFSDDIIYRFIDVPIENCGKSSPVKIVTQLGLPDKLLIFLRYGASIYNEEDDGNPIEIIMKRLLEFNHVYPFTLVACLQILLRVTPTVKFRHLDDSVTTQSYIEENYAELVSDAILPITRCGVIPPDLKHICRCVIRDKMMENYQLPIGIKALPIPYNLQRYIDILED
ncbi:unnamed protein product [Brassicogethes aeneus]|uniref:SOCS box domain-containing protein n=1 Tax=Brassicogethes aeneus TaxID=1431903 RepID=A0A9P0BDB9_BRAAE|nr:unnamed protein product [Brassicogethes aeneus]